MKNRDYNLDFFRGFAAIWIIFIHTCFCSGGYYLPEWIRTFSLIIDVPLFIFISGATFNFSNSVIKTVKGLVKLWAKYLCFLVLYFIIIFIIDRPYFNFNNILNSLFFNFNNNKLMAVEWSFWFIFMYFIVSLIGSIIICIYKTHCKDLKDFKYVIILIFLLYGMALSNPNFIFINSKYLMYLFLFLLGYYLYNKKLDTKKFVVSIIINILLVIGLLKITSFNILDMQLAKGSSHFLYLAYTFMSINVFMFLKDKLNFSSKNIFSKIGKDALLFYFCQGIGSSLIYEIYPHISSYNNLLIFIIMFLSNILITVLCVVCVRIIKIVIDKIIFAFKRIFKEQKA